MLERYEVLITEKIYYINSKPLIIEYK